MGIWRFALLALAAAAASAQQQRLRPAPAPAPGNAGAFSDKGNLQYLFDRPVQQMFYPKGRNGEVFFDLPANYVDPRYRNRQTQLGDRFGTGAGAGAGSRRVTVPPVTTRLTALCAQQTWPPCQLKRHEHFSTFLPAHREMARDLVAAFMSREMSYEQFASSAFFCRDRLNPFLFSYAMSVAILHRNDTRGVQLPLFACRFPEKFFDRALFTSARQETNLANPGERAVLEIPLDWTGTNLDPEHRVAYFREDMGINLGHWHWHLAYPFNGPAEIVGKDRRGEIFYYFHQQIISRYNFERLSNRLGRVKRFNNWREPIEEGYFPKLDSLVASRVWPPRHAGAILRDIDRPDFPINFDIQDLERWRDRIFEAIHRGSVQDTSGRAVRLDEQRGIDLLGNIVEASNISINFNLYGDMHNLGHVAMGLCHDPDHRHLENFNIMADPGTTMRDPLFYRWHGFVDDLFHEHKKTLPPYTEAQLGFSGVQVTAVALQAEGVAQPNRLSTFWQKSDIDFSRGLDFQPRGPVLARVTHLQHAPFRYRVTVRNGGAARQGTVRIFLAPRVDEREAPLRFEDQRLLFIELDKFTVNLRAGENVFERNSTQSAVTIPFERTFQDLDEQPAEGAPGRDQFSYCGCGWPHHMLIPKGSAAGLGAELFVMVSNFADDRVEQAATANACTRGHSYCGLLGQRYPDRRPMGFPFDRRARPGAQTLAQFLTPNMRVTPVTIHFSERTVAPPADRFGSSAGGVVLQVSDGPLDRRPPGSARPRPNNGANRPPLNRARPPGNSAPPRRN